jgi:N-acetylmuramoyl-L-alanine amidase
VKPGECIGKIAQQYGVRDWKNLWDDLQNAALKKRRKNPQVLSPGDEVMVSPRVYEIARATDARHTIEVERGEKRVRVWLRTLGDRVLTNVEYDYSYTLASGLVEKPGSAPTDDQGKLEETVPINVRRLHVTLRKSKFRLSYDVSSLEPARDDDSQTAIASGVQQRLRALGYPAVPSGTASEDTSALALFQQLNLNRKAPQGAPDQETLGALERSHTA